MLNNGFRNRFSRRIDDLSMIETSRFPDGRAASRAARSPRPPLPPRRIFAHRSLIARSRRDRRPLFELIHIQPLPGARARGTWLRRADTGPGRRAAPETGERDLLVSAQTGSGKTVAYGLAIADTLLGGEPTSGPPGRRSRW